ncbi:PREDICTED: uncharacterized protein LOC103343241 [Prunus mume]|uniref:histidine kinase n=1 Tax=Prunus mume TaxID=102107 RepID=A0ABM0PVH2_PRUMU|nr:PREDICTED: uncharacterized protein LOC103343241 [Prunus mume]
MAKLREEIAVQKAKETELNKTIHITEETMRAKQMLATMSHEIRSPLSGVVSMAEILTTTKLDREQRQLLDVMLSSGDLVLQLINDILDLSKVESGMVAEGGAPAEVAVEVAATTEVAEMLDAEAAVIEVPATEKAAADMPDDEPPQSSLPLSMAAVSMPPAPLSPDSTVVTELAVVEAIATEAPSRPPVSSMVLIELVAAEVLGAPPATEPQNVMNGQQSQNSIGRASAIDPNHVVVEDVMEADGGPVLRPNSATSLEIQQFIRAMETSNQLNHQQLQDMAQTKINERFDQLLGH